MRFPMAFQGKMRRLPYALATFAVFFGQHLASLIALKAQGSQADLHWYFYLMPLRSLAKSGQASDVMLGLALMVFLLAAWGLAALAFRRAADANLSGWIAAFALAPAIQIAVILFLCLAPSRSAASLQHAELPNGWAAAQGVIVGTGVTLSAVAMGTLLFGSYSHGVFVVAPFVIGAATAFIANRHGDVGASHTSKVVAIALLLGGIILVAAAVEGIVCLILAAPLGLGVALVGGMLGRAIALQSRRTVHKTVSAFTLLPLVFATETVLPAITTFDTRATVEINASPETVWKAIVAMETIERPMALPFRLGVAYPLRGEVIGEGVGASRIGEFSTGTAVERVTEWIPNSRLAFKVVRDVPAMRELSPYEHVHAPHVIGYFHTTNTSFDLSPKQNGRTEIVERTSHSLKLEPILYWLPLARWVVQRNNLRVLATSNVKRSEPTVAKLRRTKPALCDGTKRAIAPSRNADIVPINLPLPRLRLLPSPRSEPLHHLNVRLPIAAPAMMTTEMARQYQARMKKGKSSGQCVA